MNIKKYMIWLPAVLVSAAIFYFSAQPADVSSELSGRVTMILLKIAELTGLLELSPERVTELCIQLSFPIRKAAHVTEYLILHGTILFALWERNGRHLTRRQILQACIMTIAYACTDEFHQIFVPGRAGRVVDVGIDSLGVSLVTVWLLRRRKRYESSGTERTAL